MKLIVFLFFSLVICNSFARTISLRHAANVIKIKGEAKVKRLHQVAFIKLKNKDPIFEGDIIKTSPDSLLRIQYSDKTITTMGPKALLEIVYFRKKPKRRNILKVIQGQIRVWVREKANDLKDVMKVKTRNVSIGVRGTEFFTNVYPMRAGTTTDLFLLEGDISGTFKSGKKLNLKPGEYINSTNLSEGIKTVSNEALARLLKSKESLLPELITKDGRLKTKENILEEFLRNDEHSEGHGVDIQIEKSSTSKGRKGQKNSTEININIPTYDD
jgi:hypothetical protein